MRAALLQLAAVVRARSDLMRTPPRPDRSTIQVELLRHLARFHRAFVRDPRAWPGATGHPLHVAHALASHLLGTYPTPPFLASVWLAGDRTRQRWFVAHARGQRVRSLALPIAMSRQMEHVFLRSPHHLSVDHALRRAEVIALGGSPALAGAILATRLGHAFADGAYWRAALGWMVRRESTLDLGQIGRLVAYLHATKISLRGRTAASVGRLVDAYRDGAPPSSWARSRWRGLVCTVGETRWTLTELLERSQLAREGRAMHNCVERYARHCVRGQSAIYALRRGARSVLTIEVRPSLAAIVQVRGPRNAPPAEQPLEILRAWAQREQLALRLG